jgi:hypothetical protein
VPGGGAAQRGAALRARGQAVAAGAAGLRLGPCCAWRLRVARHVQACQQRHPS